MPTLPIIEDLDELENIGGSVSSCSIISTMHPLPFERGEETFRHRVVVTIPLPTHAACDTLIPKQFLEIVAGILTAPIGVMNETR